MTGAACVQSTPPDNTTPAAFYIVGGTSNSTTYPGLQRYIFNTGTWETITPSVSVTQNRLYHSAVYLNASASLLVYAGAQDGVKYPSTQTFTIGTTAPYNVLSYESLGAPPAVQPILLQWSDSEAVMLGGGDTNKAVYLFEPKDGWVNLNASLATALTKDIDSVKGIIVQGSDQSKNFLTFDMTTSPNTVNRTVLVDGSGNPVQTAAVVARSLNTEVVEASIHKRDNLTVANWPTYNSTFVPTSTRSGYALAQSPNGLVVVAGGNTQDVLCMFQADTNSWLNASNTFSKAQVSQQPLSSTTLSSSTVSSTSTPTSLATTSAMSTPTSATSSDDTGRASTTKILGIVLGTIGGIALLLALVLLLLRWHRKRREFAEAGHQRRSSGIPDDEKAPMEYSERGMAFRGHMPSESSNSFSSMAILMGKVNNSKGGMISRRKGSNGSDSSSAFNRKYKTAISKPILQDQQPTGMSPEPHHGYPEEKETGAVSFVPEPISQAGINSQASSSQQRPRGPNSSAPRRGSTRRSSGWNRYWSGGSALNVLGFGSKRTTYEGNDLVSDRSSNYSQDVRSSQNARTTLGTIDTQHSAIPAPLVLGDPSVRMSLNRVPSGSPTIQQHNEGGLPSPLHQEMSGYISRHSSVSSASSYTSRIDDYSSGIPEGIVDEQRSWDPTHWAGQGHQSAAYSESNYGPRTPMNTTYAQQVQDARAPGGADRSYKQLAVKDAKPTSAQDMSWLNLGHESRI